MHAKHLNRISEKLSQAALRLGSGIAAAALLCLAPPTAHAARALDWTKTTETKVALFYPGQSSWEWVMTQKDHSGAKKFREGKNCKSCHEGEQKAMGEKLVKGGKLEPTPPLGKSPTLTLKVATMRDEARLYFRLRWTGAAPGGAKLDPEYAERVTVMLDDGHIKEATRAGCWGSCHDDAIGMASAPKGAKISKYLAASRSKITRSGGGENFKPAAALDQMLKTGNFIEYWHARLNPGKPAQAIGGYILEKRHELSGSGVAAEATQKNGEWTVVLSRPLKATQPGQKDLVPGKTYSIGFSVHDNYANHRFHHVSFEQTLVLDQGKANFVATKK